MTHIKIEKALSLINSKTVSVIASAIISLNPLFSFFSMVNFLKRVRLTNGGNLVSFLYHGV